MTTTQHEAAVAIATALDTALNSLANVTASSESSAIDNTTDRYLFIDLELNIGAQTARTAGAWIGVYATYAPDGTNYSRAHQLTAELVAVFEYDAATTATRSFRRDRPIGPYLFKLFVYNSSTQALAASGNTLKYRLHSVESV